MNICIGGINVYHVFSVQTLFILLNIYTSIHNTKFKFKILNTNKIDIINLLYNMFTVYIILKIMLDQQGNLRIIVKKIKPLLGIAIEGGINTKHLLPRIINIHVSINNK